MIAAAMMPWVPTSELKKSLAPLVMLINAWFLTKTKTRHSIRECQALIDHGFPHVAVRGLHLIVCYQDRPIPTQQ